MLFTGLKHVDDDICNYTKVKLNIRDLKNNKFKNEFSYFMVGIDGNLRVCDGVLHVCVLDTDCLNVGNCCHILETNYRTQCILLSVCSQNNLI